MEQPYNSATGTERMYRLFLARVISGWIFLLLLYLWITKSLPHHLPELAEGIKADAQVIAAYSCIWMMVSTLLLFFLIVPGRFLAGLLTLLMGIFMQCYQYGGTGFLNPAFVVVFIPFLLPVSWFKRSWQVLKWVLPVLLALHSWFLPLSWKAVPGYTVYCIAFLPWERWFVSFIERFEPK